MEVATPFHRCKDSGSRQPKRLDSSHLRTQWWSWSRLSRRLTTKEAFFFFFSLPSLLNSCDASWFLLLLSLETSRCLHHLQNKVQIAHSRFLSHDGAPCLPSRLAFPGLPLLALLSVGPACFLWAAFTFLCAVRLPQLQATQSDFEARCKSLGAARLEDLGPSPGPFQMGQGTSPWRCHWKLSALCPLHPLRMLSLCSHHHWVAHFFTHVLSLTGLPAAGGMGPGLRDGGPQCLAQEHLHTCSQDWVVRDCQPPPGLEHMEYLLPVTVGGGRRPDSPLKRGVTFYSKTGDSDVNGEMSLLPL